MGGEQIRATAVSETPAMLPGLFRSFTGHFFGLFVFAQAEEGGLAEVVVAGPFGEADFANELRIKPGAVFHFGGGEAAAEAAGFFREIHEGAIGPGEFLKFLVE